MVAKSVAFNALIIVLSLLLMDCEANNCTTAEDALFSGDERCAGTFSLFLDGTSSADICVTSCKNLVQEVLDLCGEIYPVIIENRSSYFT